MNFDPAMMANMQKMMAENPDMVITYEMYESAFPLVLLFLDVCRNTATSPP